jgi:nitrate reductase beta subunit
MAKVWNWQINREMNYPHEESRPKKQFAAVFDTNKCIACQTCTMACKHTWTSGRGQEYMFWNNVETKPYGFYPLGWDVKILSLLGVNKWGTDAYQGKTVFEAAPAGQMTQGYLPEDLDWAHPNIGEDEPLGTVDKGDFFSLPHKIWCFYLPRLCNHCTYPACLAACPRKAIYKREEDGIVLVDQSRCRGYRECMRACPYKKVLYNAVTRVSEKCIGCFPLVEQGLQTQCVTTCIGKIRLNGWISPPDKADPERPIDYLVRIKKLALPLYPQTGLEPNIYYIPPIHVPLDYLHQMFGPQVDQAIELYKNIKNDEELLGCLTLFGSTNRWVEKFKIKDGYAYGFDTKGAEIVKVPLKEPVYIRPFRDEQHQAYRHNTP